jgi:hypothetical protein
VHTRTTLKERRKNDARCIRMLLDLERYVAECRII